MRHLLFICFVLSLSLVSAIDLRNQNEVAQLLKEKKEALDKLTPLFKQQQRSNQFERGVNIIFNLTSGVAAQPNTSSVGYNFYTQEGVPVLLEVTSTSNDSIYLSIYSVELGSSRSVFISPGQNYTEELSSTCSAYFFVINAQDYQSVTIKATNRPGVNALTIGGAAKYRELPADTIYTYYIDVVQRCSNFTIVAVPENGTNSIEYFQSFLCPVDSPCSFVQIFLQTGPVGFADFVCIAPGRYWFGIVSFLRAVNYTIRAIPRNCPPCVNYQGECEYQHPNYVCDCVDSLFTGAYCQNADNSTIQAPVNNYQLAANSQATFYITFGTIVTDNVIINVSSDVTMQDVRVEIFHADYIANIYVYSKDSVTWELASPLVSNRTVFIRVTSNNNIPHNISISYSLVPRTVSALPASYSVANPSDFRMYRIPNPPPVLVATLRTSSRKTFYGYAGVAIVKSDNLDYDEGNSLNWDDELPNFDIVVDDDDTVVFQSVFKCNNPVDALYVGVSLRSNSTFNLTIGPPANCLNGCNKQGYCNTFGNCECFESFSGADCSVGSTQINFNTIVSGNATSDLIFFVEAPTGTTYDQIGLVSYLPSTLTLNTLNRGRFDYIYQIYSAESYFLCDNQPKRYYVRVSANQAYSFKLVTLSAVALNGISTFNLTFGSPVLFKTTTTVSTQADVEVTSNDTFIVQTFCNTPQTTNTWSVSYSICSPFTQYIVLSVPFGQTAQVSVNVTYSTPPQCPNCCGGLGDCDSQNYTCNNCPSLYATGSDCSTPVCYDARNLLYCPSSTPRSLSPFFSGSGASGCTLREIDAYLNLVFQQELGEYSTDCRNYAPEYFCDIYFPRCSGSSLITSCSDKCDLFTSLCGACGEEALECEDLFKSPYLNYTCAPVLSTTGSITTGRVSSASTSTSGNSSTSSGDESSSTFLVPSFLIVLLTIIYA